MIVKCQRSLSTTTQFARMLFYDQSGNWMWEGDLTKEWEDRFPDRGDLAEQNRFFAEVRWGNMRHPPEFIRKLPEQHW